MIDDFIGVFDGVNSPKECQQLIRHFEFLKSRNLIHTRQQLKDGPTFEKHDETAFLLEDDVMELTWGQPMMDAFVTAVWDSYKEYADKYSILTTAENHGMVSIRLQRTQKGGGYHRWHFEQAASAVSRRMIAWILYLNDVDEGGETEFLYQSKRVSAKAGRLVIFPASFTHTHRGNPPLSGEKYILTGWLEFIGNSK